MANRNFPNSRLYTGHVMPVYLDTNFVVNSASTTGVSSLKGPFVSSVIMQTQTTPALTPAFGTARGFGILGASAVTSTGATAIAGDLGVYPGSAITGFPPGTFTGALHVTDVQAQAAQASALATYTDLQARAFTGITSELGTQSLTAGVYKATSGTAGTFTLNGTLTLTGSATDIFVFQTTTTLITGGTSTPVITLAGGALASNIYWVVGSSATLNSSFGAAAIFKGNIIASASITDTLGGTVQGSLVALNGAVTLSAATTITTQSLASSGPAAGTIIVNLADNYSRLFNHDYGIISPLFGPSPGGTQLTSATSGTAYTITGLGTASGAQWIAAGFPVGVTPAVGLDFVASATGTIGGGATVQTATVSTVTGTVYTITALGTATLAQWQAAGFPVGFTPAVGAPFYATATGTIGGAAAVQQSATAGSGINGIEVVGYPNYMISNSQAGVGSQIILQCYSNGVKTAPAAGSLISLSFYLSNSSVVISGE